MIRIRQEQALVLERASFERTSDWIVAILRDVFPNARLVDEATLHEGVTQQLKRAQIYAFERDDHAAIYVATAWALGEDFPEKFSAAQAILQSHADSGYPPNFASTERASGLVGAPG